MCSTEHGYEEISPLLWHQRVLKTDEHLLGTTVRDSPGSCSKKLHFCTTWLILQYTFHFGARAWSTTPGTFNNHMSITVPYVSTYLTARMVSKQDSTTWQTWLSMVPFIPKHALIEEGHMFQWHFTAHSTSIIFLKEMATLNMDISLLFMSSPSEDKIQSQFSSFHSFSLFHLHLSSYVHQWKTKWRNKHTADSRYDEGC